MPDHLKRWPMLLKASKRNANGCLLWAGAIDPWGYGRIGHSLAHRRMYTMAVGPIPEGMTIDHLCFEPSCIEPSHLRVLSRSENSRNQRVAYRTHCNHGHEFTPENTYWPPGKHTRVCRTCQRAAVARYAARKRGIA